MPNMPLESRQPHVL